MQTSETVIVGKSKDIQIEVVRRMEFIKKSGKKWHNDCGIVQLVSIFSFSEIDKNTFK
jgi:hypothetical protein